MNLGVTDELGEAERLAVAYAPSSLRARYAAVFALDGVLLRVALVAREPLPAQLKLAWWREACVRLPGGRDHPVLAGLAETWPEGTTALVALVDAWEAVAVAEGGYLAAGEAVAQARSTAFAICAGEAEGVARDAARAWTLATLAGHAPGDDERAALRAAARQLPAPQLPRTLRPLAVLAGLARRALAADRGDLIGDRWSPLVAMRLGIFGR